MVNKLTQGEPDSLASNSGVLLRTMTVEFCLVFIKFQKSMSFIPKGSRKEKAEN